MQDLELVAFDREQMLERLGGDSELLHEVLEVFLEECPRMMRELDEAVASEDAERLRRSAHSFKGALLNISASAAAAQARQLEDLAEARSLEGRHAVVERLKIEIDRLQDALVEQASA